MYPTLTTNPIERIDHLQEQARALGASDADIEQLDGILRDVAQRATAAPELEQLVALWRTQLARLERGVPLLLNPSAPQGELAEVGMHALRLLLDDDQLPLDALARSLMFDGAFCIARIYREALARRAARTEVTT